MGGAGGVAMAPSAMPTSPNDIILVPGNQTNNHGNSFPGQQMPTIMNPLPEETRPLPSVPPKREYLITIQSALDDTKLFGPLKSLLDNKFPDN